MADPVTTLVDLGPVLQAAISFVATVVLAVGGFALHKLNVWLSAKTGHQNLINEDQVRGYLQTALDNAAHYAVAKVGSADWAHVDTKNALIAAAANYALEHVPDALSYFKVDEAGLAALIEARLAKLFPA